MTWIAPVKLWLDPTDSERMKPVVSGELATSAAPSLEEVAQAANASDLFLFRRIGGDRFAHVGGCGRGEGWAGIVEVGLSEEPLLDAALSNGDHARRDGQASEHAFGPYYARSVVITPVNDDVFVVFGSESTTVSDLSAKEFRELGSYASGSLLEVSPAKRLADELELVNAVRELLSAPAGDLDEALTSTASCVTEALSCDAGVLYLREPERVVVVRKGWEPDGTEDELVAVMRELSARDEFPICIQDAAASDLPGPFSSSDGVTSYYLLELTEPLEGVLLLLHTRVAPRGFTNLCQTLGLRLVDTSATVLSAALAREKLRDEVDRAAQEARRDPLTGLANRLAWDEAVAAARCTSGFASVIQLDCRGLRQVNNEHGHHAGDLLLQALGQTLADSVRDGDLVARLGGDEFAVLLCGADESECSKVVDRIRTNVAAHPPVGGAHLGVSIGSATANGPEVDVAATQRRADVQMVRDKHTRARPL